MRRFGFSSGFLDVLFLFHNSIKYSIDKNFKNNVKGIDLNINKDRKVN
jgi:hypothetical protein